MKYTPLAAALLLAPAITLQAQAASLRVAHLSESMKGQPLVFSSSTGLESESIAYGDIVEVDYNHAPATTFQVANGSQMVLEGTYDKMLAGEDYLLVASDSADDGETYLRLVAVSNEPLIGPSVTVTHASFLNSTVEGNNQRGIQSTVLECNDGTETRDFRTYFVHGSFRGSVAALEDGDLGGGSASFTTVTTPLACSPLIREYPMGDELWRGESFEILPGDRYVLISHSDQSLRQVIPVLISNEEPWPGLPVDQAQNLAGFYEFTGNPGSGVVLSVDVSETAVSYEGMLLAHDDNGDPVWAQLANRDNVQRGGTVATTRGRVQVAMPVPLNGNDRVALPSFRGALTIKPLDCDQIALHIYTPLNETTGLVLPDRYPTQNHFIVRRFHSSEQTDCGGQAQ